MERDKQMKRDLKNKKYQAQEEYEKNKPLLAETVIQEKKDYIRPAEQRNGYSKEDKNESRKGSDKESK